MPQQPKYWAFISYSHQDTAWSDWLFKALETYRIPRRLVGRETRAGIVPPRLYPVFRDRDELPGSAELSVNLVRALKESRYLIVICSPQAARSRWVDEEVRTFKALGGEARTLALVVSGEPNASDKPDSGMLECFPPALRFRHLEGMPTAERIEPIAADVRPGRETRSIALLRLVAGILGVEFDELRQRERQRVRARRWRIALGSLAAAAAASLAGAWSFVDARIERHIESGRIALVSRDYSRAAPWLVSALRMQERLPHARKRPHLPVMLGLAMTQVERLERVEPFAGTGTYATDFDAARLQLAQGVRESRIVVAQLGSAGGAREYPIGQKVPNHVRFEPAGDSLVYMADDDGIHRLDLRTGEASRIMPIPSQDGAEVWGITRWGRALNVRYKDRREFVRVPDGKVLATIPAPWASRVDDLGIGDDKGEVTLATTRGDGVWSVHVVRLVDGGIARTIHVDFFPSAARFDPAGKRVAIVSGYSDRHSDLPYRDTHLGAVGVWDVTTGAQLWKTRFPARFRDVSFSSDGSRLVTTAGDHRAVAWDAKGGHPIAFLNDPDSKIRDAYFFPDDPSRVLTLSWDAAPRVWDVETGVLVAKLDGLQGFFATVWPLPGARVAAIRDQGDAGLLLWNLESRNGVRTLAGHDSPVRLRPTGDDSRIFSTDRNGKGIVWDSRSLRAIGSFGGNGEALALSADGRLYVASGRGTGRIRIGRVDDGAVVADARLEHGLRSIVGWNAKDVVIAVDDQHRIVGIGKGLEVRTLARHGRIDGIGMTLSGERVGVLAGDRLRILDAVHGNEVATFPRIGGGEGGGVIFSRSGDRLVEGQYWRAVWQLVDLQTRRAHRLPIIGTASALGVRFVCDDRFVVVVLDNARFQLHDGHSGEILRTFEGARDSLGSITCDPAGGLLVGGDRSGSFTIWRIEGGPPIAQAKIADSLDDLQWLPGIRAVVAAAGDSRLYLLPLPVEGRATTELERVLRCRTPYRVDGNELKAHEDSPECLATTSRGKSAE